MQLGVHFTIILRSFIDLAGEMSLPPFTPASQLLRQDAFDHDYIFSTKM